MDFLYTLNVWICSFFVTGFGCCRSTRRNRLIQNRPERENENQIFDIGPRLTKLQAYEIVQYNFERNNPQLTNRLCIRAWMRLKCLEPETYNRVLNAAHHPVQCSCNWEEVYDIAFLYLSGQENKSFDLALNLNQRSGGDFFRFPVEEYKFQINQLCQIYQRNYAARHRQAQAQFNSNHNNHENTLHSRARARPRARARARDRDREFVESVSVDTYQLPPIHYDSGAGGGKILIFLLIILSVRFCFFDKKKKNQRNTLKQQQLKIDQSPCKQNHQNINNKV